MDINLSAKLLKYTPSEVQTVTYVVEYATHNSEDLREAHEYIEEQLKTSRLIEIADIILESKNMATINAKPSGASGKIDTIKEKPSTEGPVTAAQRSVSGKKVAKEEFLPEEESDRMNDARLERGGMGAGRGGNSSSAKVGPKKPAPSGKSAMTALEIVKQATMAKYGKGSIMSSYEADGEEDLLEDDRRREMARERRAERNAEDTWRKTSKVGEKKTGPKLSTVKHSETKGADYAEREMRSIAGHDRVTKKAKHTQGNPFPESVQYDELDEATAMAKRGHNETAIRKKIAANTGGGESADRATALENKPTFGDSNKTKQRQRYARAQRSDFRKTTSSSPGLHGYGHKATNADDKAKQDARGKQRGVLTKGEKKQLNMEMEYDLNEAGKAYGGGEDPCWKGYKQVGMKMKNGREVPNCVPVSEAWMWELVDELAEDFDFLTQEDLEDVIIEAMVEIEDDVEMLDEALDMMSSYDVYPLFEDYYAAAASKSKENAAKPEVKAAVRRARVEKVKTAAKAVGSTLKSKADAARAKVGSAASSAKSAVSSAASKAGEAAKSAGSSVQSAASSAKKGLKAAGKKVVGAASRAAGHAVGEYQAARIKAKRDSLSKSKPKAAAPSDAPKKPESKDAETRRKGEELLDKIRSSGGQKKSSSSSGGGGTSRTTTTTTTTTTRSSGGSSGGSSSKSSGGGSDKPSLLRRAASAVKRGIKKVVGKTARAVSSGAGRVAKRMGEGTSWRERLGYGVEQIDEISSHLALTASQKADEVRRKAAISGDRETAAKKAAQASRLYKGVGPRKARERKNEAN